MFSKDWKVAVLSIMTLALVTACGHDKKKDKPAGATTYWVNAQAYDLLIQQGVSARPDICTVVQQNICANGILPGDNVLRLDAWKIGHNGLVFRTEWLSIPGSPSNQPVGTLAGETFMPKNANPLDYRYMGRQQGSALLCRSPFETGAASARMEGRNLWIQSAQAPLTYYVQVTQRELDDMNRALSACRRVPVRGAPAPAMGQMVPLPGQGPEVGPQDFDQFGKPQDQQKQQLPPK